jgi:hypothetical protein
VQQACPARTGTGIDARSTLVRGHRARLARRAHMRALDGYGLVRGVRGGSHFRDIRFWTR